MSKRFTPLQDGQRIEIYLENGMIREGRFRKWMLAESAFYLIVDKDEYFEDGKHISGSWFMSEKSIKLIYPL